MAKLNSTRIYGNLNVDNDVYLSGQLKSLVATGTAPFTIASTTLVNNLNAQYLNGQLGSYYAAASSLGNYLPLAGGTMTGSITSTASNPVISKLSGYKSWVEHHPTSGSLIFAPSSSANGIDWDWANQITFSDAGNINAKSFTSTITGTAPFTVASTIKVSNLNADLLDDLSSASFFRADTSNSVDVRLASGDGRGLRFWDSDSYKIWMSIATNGTYGGRISGDTTSDYNMYFRMASGTNRGFVFESAYATKLFSINPDGVRSAVSFISPTILLGSTSTATGNMFTDITASGQTKTVNLGTGGAAGSTTNVNIGSSVAGTTTISSPTVSIPGNLIVSGTVTTNNVETVSTSNGIIFEGDAADAYELTLLAGTLSADRTITLPDATGIVALTSDSLKNPNALTIGSGLSGTSYDGSAAITIAHSNSITAETTGKGEIGKTLTYGGTFKVPSVLKYDAQGHITAVSEATFTMPANPDTNYYPTSFSWTNGTSAGPTGSLSGTGMSTVSFGAIPYASENYSGILTTGTQTIAGDKTFLGNLSASQLNISGNPDQEYLVEIGPSASILYINIDDVLRISNNNGPIAFYNDGSSQFSFNNVFSITPSLTETKLAPSANTGTNIAGKSLKLYAGAGTGNATGSTIDLYTPSPRLSGSVVQSSDLRLSIGGTSNAPYIKFNHSTASAFTSGFRDLGTVQSPANTASATFTISPYINHILLVLLDGNTAFSNQIGSVILSNSFGTGFYAEGSQYKKTIYVPLHNTSTYSSKQVEVYKNDGDTTFTVTNKSGAQIHVKAYAI